MGGPRVAFDATDDPKAYLLLEKLTSQGVSLKEIEHGYSRANYGGIHCATAKGLSCIKGARDGEISSTEVWEFVLNQWGKYQQLVEGVLGRPLPWVLDDFNPKTTFDAEVRKSVGDIIEMIRTSLEQQGLKKTTTAYEERLAVALYYLVASPKKSGAVPHDPKQAEIRKTFETKRAQVLASYGLSSFETYLQSAGGMRVEGDSGKEYSALDALFIEEGKCTEQSKILFGVFTMAGLSPIFIDVNPRKTKLPDMMAALQQSPYYGHVCIGVRIGKKLRLFDPALLLVDPPHVEFYPLTPRQFLSADYVQRGQYFKARGNYTDARKSYDLALLLDSWSATLFLNRGHLFYKEGQSKQAVADYSEAIRLNPNMAMAYSNLCDLLARENEWEKALKDCDKAIQLDPDYAQAYINRAYISARGEKWLQVIEDASKALSLNPTLLKAYNFRAGAFLNTGDFEGSIADLTACLKYTVTPEERFEIYRNRALVYGKHKDWEKAIQDYSAALKIKPGDNDILSKRGEAWAYKGELDRAIADFTAVIENDPASAMTYFIRGQCWLLKGDTPKGIQDITNSLRLAPGSTKHVFDLLLPLIREHWKTQQDGQVVKSDLQDKLGLDAEQLQAWVETIRLLWMAGHKTSAVKELGSILKSAAETHPSKRQTLGASSVNFLKSLFDHLPSDMQNDTAVKSLWQQMGAPVN